MGAMRLTAARIAPAVLLACATFLRAGDFTDPAPPTVQQLAPASAPEAQKNPDTTFHAPPKPLPAGAVTQDDWTTFLGGTHDLVSPETKMLERFPADGMKIVWETTRGSGYAAPAIKGQR